MIEFKYKTVPGGYWVEWIWQNSFARFYKTLKLNFLFESMFEQIQKTEINKYV